LETALQLGLKLVEENVISFESLVEKVSKNPARILGLQHGLVIGNSADLTVIDPDLHHTIHADSFFSKSRNTPFNGWQMKGKAVLTVVGGRIVFNELTKDNQLRG
jgi:dihydroorotase